MGSLSSAHSRNGSSGGADSASEIFAAWLKSYSAEVTTPDRKSLDSAAGQMWPNAPVYIASLPKDNSDKQLQVAIRLRELGLRPVPHVVARNFTDERSFVSAIRNFAELAQVDRALILGGDRDEPLGPFDASLQLIQSGVLEDNGITRIAIACYPEGHPRISDAQLEDALLAKLDAARFKGLNVRLITQLCFEAQPILRFVRSLRAASVDADLRVGLAGPARLPTLLKYAAICGVGSSLRALRSKNDLAGSLLKAETPSKIGTELAEALAREPSLAITGLHFFTFASLAKTIEWARAELARQAGA